MDQTTFVEEIFLHLGNMIIGYKAYLVRTVEMLSYTKNYCI